MTKKNYKYIASNPKVMGGTLVVKNTRIPLARVLFLLKDGYTLGNVSEQTQISEPVLDKAVSEFIKYTSIAPNYDKEIYQVQTAL